jgi:L-lactate utilization protein LutB
MTDIRNYPRVVHLAACTLTSGGAYTNQAKLLVDEAEGEVTYMVTYCPTCANGYPVFKHEIGNGTEAGIEQAVNPAGTFGSSTVTVDLYDQVLDCNALHTGAAGTSATCPITVTVGRGITTTRLLAADVGNTTNPGAIAITVVGGCGR